MGVWLIVIGMYEAMFNPKTGLWLIAIGVGLMVASKIFSLIDWWIGREG